MSLSSQRAELQALLDESAARHGVVGAALAVGRGSERVECASGLVNRDTGVEATPDAVFQIGSITKLFTTTLVMQLVEEGRLDLEAPVKQALPEFEVADAEATTAITLAQLLSHTSGIDGDFFLDAGPGDDCIERFVLACNALPQLHRPGEMFSYCNAGFVVAGRMVEKLRARPWPGVLAERLLWPLGLFAMGTEPEQAILHRAAVGHMALGPGAEPSVIPIWRLARASAPAGSTAFARARDLLAFARLHLDEGRAPGGARLLGAESVRAMQEARIELPEHHHADAQGLGWMLFDWDGERVLGHDGGTIGQASFLRVHPGSGLAVSLLTTGGDAPELYRDVFGHVFETACGIALPTPVDALPTAEVPLDPYAGRYSRLSTRYDLVVEDGALVIEATGQKPPFSLLPPVRSRLRAVSPRAFAVETPGGMLRSPVLFSRFDENGRPGSVEVAARSAPRVR